MSTAPTPHNSSSASAFRTPVTNSTPTNPAPDAGKQAGLAEKLRSKKARDKAAGPVQQHQTSIEVRTPNKQWYFRASKKPDLSFPIDILVIDGGEYDGTWFLDPETEFPGELETHIVPALITLCITSNGTLFFYLAKQSPKSPKDSTRRCIHQAKVQWIKQHWNAEAKSYNWEPARLLRKEPVWPDDTPDQLLEKAFGDHYINRADHPAINCLLYPEDGDGVADDQQDGE